MKSRFSVLVATATLATIGVGMYAWNGFGSADPAEQQRSVSDSQARAAEATPRHADSSTRAANACVGRQPLFSFKATYVSADPIQADNMLAQAYTNPSAVLANSATDPQANIALYRFAKLCLVEPERDAGPASATPRRACPSTAGVSNIFRTDPIELLQKAADQGSVDAKRMFAFNAPQLAEQFRKSGTAEGEAFARDLMKHAEHYGIDAARAGSIDAMRYMSSAYEQGRFGEPDLKRAYQFALPLRYLGNAEDKNRLIRLDAKLAEPDRILLQREALGCESIPGEAVLANPFR